VRREALRQWLWEKAEAWALKQTPGALALALGAHGYERDPAAALERMTDAETETLILHERGEHAAGKLLGPGWPVMIASFRKRRPEILARAVRDNLADCLVTLPVLLERQAWPQLWFWFSNFDGMRRELFPALANFDYAKVGAGGTKCPEAGMKFPVAGTALQEIVQRGAAHFELVARRLLVLDEAAIAALSHDTQTLALA